MPRQRWRYIAQRALTNEFLHWNLPMSRDSLAWDLSGPGQLVGTLSPQMAQLIGPDGSLLLDEWKTYIYAEQNGELRWGGILTSSGFVGSKWQITCQGFTGYPSGISYTGAVYNAVNANPVTVFNTIWSHVQAQPDGNLGVTISNVGTCPVRIGSTDEPYTLAWYEERDCGSELADLASTTPFDFIESHTWGTGQTINHRVTTNYPRAGRKRTDIAFIQNANIIGEPVAIGRDGARHDRRVCRHRPGEIARLGHRVDPPFLFQQRVSVLNRRDRHVHACRQLTQRRQLDRRFQADFVDQVDHVAVHRLIGKVCLPLSPQVHRRSPASIRQCTVLAPRHLGDPGLGPAKQLFVDARAVRSRQCSLAIQMLQ